MRVTIHTDSSPRIGTGHGARCLALAEALVANGAAVELAAEQLVEDQRAAARGLGVRLVERAAADRQPDWVVVDAYHLEADARRRLAEPGVPRLVVDDLGSPSPDATIVANGNLYAAPGSPLSTTGAEQLLGPAYAMLRGEYAAAVPQRAVPPVPERVLVTMGGADPTDATRSVIAVLEDLEPRPAVRVAIGPAHAAAEEDTALARAAGFEAVLRPSSLLAHLAWADLVIAACGTTVLEVARLGRPLVGIVVADNQERVAAAVEAESLGVVAGRHPGVTGDALRRAYTTIAEDVAWRTRIAETGPRLVDGRGARRVVDALATGPMRLRPATEDDTGRLLVWRNDPATREASFDRRPVSAEAHTAWLRARIDDPAHRILIGELSGAPVGVVRFSLEERVATISVALDADRRGRGIGARLIGAGVARLAAEGIADHVDAWIRPENGASLAAFTAAGFRSAGEDRPDRRLFRQAISTMR